MSGVEVVWSKRVPGVCCYGRVELVTSKSLLLLSGYTYSWQVHDWTDKARIYQISWVDKSLENVPQREGKCHMEGMCVTECRCVTANVCHSEGMCYREGRYVTGKVCHRDRRCITGRGLVSCLSIYPNVHHTPLIQGLSRQFLIRKLHIIRTSFAYDLRYLMQTWVSYPAKNT